MVMKIAINRSTYRVCLLIDMEYSSPLERLDFPGPRRY